MLDNKGLLIAIGVTLVVAVGLGIAVLNEERFLEPKNLSQSAITSGYVSAHGFKGQLIGLIYAASYLRSEF